MEGNQKILSVSVELFRQYGFKTITMDDIARRAGISKKTLYEHFENKQEVVLETIRHYQQQIQQQIVTVSESSENAVEAMVRLNAMITQIYRQINPLAMLELQRFFPDAHDIFRTKMVHKDIDVIRRNIDQGMAEGLYREGLNADLLARFKMDACLMLFQPDSLMKQEYHPHAVNDEIAEHFLYGIMTAKGERLYKKYKEKYLKGLPK